MEMGEERWQGRGHGHGVGEMGRKQWGAQSVSATFWAPAGLKGRLGVATALRGGNWWPGTQSYPVAGAGDHTGGWQC